MQPILVYHIDLDSSNSLIEGRLILIDKETDVIIERYIATSGLVGYQSYNNLDDVAQGPIPPQYELNPEIPHYDVSTHPEVSNNPGISDNFYTISPNMVNIWQKSRGCFGIHADKHIPGSQGCIVLRTNQGWNGFQQQMAQLSGTGISRIPLLISYVRSPHSSTPTLVNNLIT